MSKLIFLALMLLLSVLIYSKVSLFATQHFKEPKEQWLDVNNEDYIKASCNCQTYITLINSNDATIQLNNSTIVKNEATYGSYRPQ